MSRRRAHIATVGAPIVSHVLPCLALIRELVARRHRVTYANDPFMADFIHSSGAELVPCTSPLPVADNNRPADPIAPTSLFLKRRQSVPVQADHQRAFRLSFRAGRACGCGPGRSFPTMRTGRDTARRDRPYGHAAG